MVTGEGREGDSFFGMLVRTQVTPGWTDDPLQRKDGRRRVGRRDIGWQ